jgi:hypothetical protein
MFSSVPRITRAPICSSSDDVEEPDRVKALTSWRSGTRRRIKRFPTNPEPP